jgi:hypothetical protein
MGRQVKLVAGLACLHAGDDARRIGLATGPLRYPEGAMAAQPICGPERCRPKVQSMPPPRSMVPVT